MRTSTENMLIMMIIAILLYLCSEIKSRQRYYKHSKEGFNIIIKSNLDLIIEDIYRYTRSKKEIPSNLEDLCKDRPPKERNFYKNNILTDIWGTPYRYEVEGKKIKITSAGRDKIFGTKDDVVEGITVKIKSFKSDKK